MLRESQDGYGPALNAAQSADTLARRLARFDVHLLEALPDPEAMARMHKHGRSSTHFRPDGSSFRLQISIVTVAGTPLVLMLVTGSAAQLDDEYGQPATDGFGEFLTRFGPGIAATPALDRIGREPWAMKAIVDAYRGIEATRGEPAWLAGDDDTQYWDKEALFLEPFGTGTEERLHRAGVRGREESGRFTSRRRGSMQSAVPATLAMVGGRVRDPGAGPVMAGLGQVMGLPGKRGERPRPILYVERGGLRPAQEEVDGLLPRLPAGLMERLDLPPDYYPDHWDTLQWLFRILDTPGFVDPEPVGAELEARLFSDTGLRRNSRDLTALFHNSPGAADKLIRRITDHLEEYYHREMVRRRDGLEWVITGLPWALSTADYKRLRLRWPAQDLRARHDTYLLTSTVVTVDRTETGVLQGRRRRRDNAVIYPVLEPRSEPGQVPGHLGGHDHPVPPLPQDCALRAALDMLADDHATLTAPTVELPDEATLLAAEVDTRRADLEDRELAQQARWAELDPGGQAPPAHDGPGPKADAAAQVRPGVPVGPNPADPDPADDPYRATLKSVYNREHDQIREDRAALAAAERRLTVFELEPTRTGLPVEDLWPLVRATTQDDRSLRIPLLSAFSDWELYRDAADDPHDHGQAAEVVAGCASFAFTMTLFHPAVGPRQGRVHGIYPTRARRIVDRNTRAVVEALAAGVPLADQTSARSWYLPRLRVALGASGPLRVLCILDPWLLEVTMAVCHPLLPPDGDIDGRCAGAPLDDSALRRLADDRDWPLPLLERVRWLHLHNTRTTGAWLYRPAPHTTALYRSARRLGTIAVPGPDAAVLGRPRTLPDWSIGDGVATLVPCAGCGSRRIYPSLLMENLGGLCLKCLRDRNGVQWQARYTRYLER